MGAKTLSEMIGDFSKIKLKKATVRIPKLKIIKGKIKKISQKKDDKIPISSIVDIMIKSAVDKAKIEKKEKVQVEEDKSYTSLNEDKSIESGGYGTIQKAYGTAPHTSYVDYGKLFSYLGKFRAKSPYESFANGQEQNPAEAKAFTLVDTEAMDKGARYVKYFFPKAADFHSTLTSLVPVAGMNSAEWEQFKLWMKLDPVMYRLKTSTS